MADAAQRREMEELTRAAPAEKVDGILRIFSACGVDAWARELKEQYHVAASRSLDDIAVLTKRKEPLQGLTDYLLRREY